MNFILNCRFHILDKEKDLSNADTIYMPLTDLLNDKPSFLPLNIPSKYAASLIKLHGDPFSWWAGQILKYLMRFNQDFGKNVLLIKERMRFQKPCVGFVFLNIMIAFIHKNHV